MATTRFHVLLRAKVEEVINHTTSSLAHGDAKDYAWYLREVGYISGLRAALELCESIESEFDNDGRNRPVQGNRSDFKVV